MIMYRLGLALAALAIAASPMAQAGAERAPRLRVRSFNDLPQPIPLPYQEAADAEKAVAAARERAQRTRKLLLIDLGGNWCLECRLLAGVLELPEMAPFVRRHFEFVSVDVGRFDRNLAIPARYGLAKLHGVPALLVVDPVSGRLVNRGREEALADARSMSPQALADWLAQWTR